MNVMKKIIVIVVMLLLVRLASAAVTNLFPNGNFDSPAGANWVEVFGGGTTTSANPLPCPTASPSATRCSPCGPI